MNEDSHDYSLKAVTKKFEGKFAVLETADGQQVHWPIKDLPDDVQAGTEVRLLVSSKKTADEEREQVAQLVLNKIIAP